MLGNSLEKKTRLSDETENYRENVLFPLLQFNISFAKITIFRSRYKFDNFLSYLQD